MVVPSGERIYAQQPHTSLWWVTKLCLEPSDSPVLDNGAARGGLSRGCIESQGFSAASELTKSGIVVRALCMLAREPALSAKAWHPGIGLFASSTSIEHAVCRFSMALNTGTQNGPDAGVKTHADNASEEAQANQKNLTEWQKSASSFYGKRNSEFYDPCEDFAKRSMRCLHRNGGDRDLCSDIFQEYRDCKKRWMEEKREARRKS